MRWEDDSLYTPTDMGYTLASGDRWWTVMTWDDPGDQSEQSFLWLCRAPSERAMPAGAGSDPLPRIAGWGTAYDRIEGHTPVWGTLSEVLEFIASERGLPGGRERWMPITVGDYWRWGEGKEPKRAASRKTIAAIGSRRKEKAE